MKIVTNEIRQLKNNLLSCNTLNLVHFITKDLFAKEGQNSPGNDFLNCDYPFAAWPNTIGMVFVKRISKSPPLFSKFIFSPKFDMNSYHQIPYTDFFIFDHKFSMMKK